MPIKVQKIADYRDFFDEDPPEDPIDLIKDISKKAVLYELAALNYRLKPRGQIVFDTSEKTQLTELYNFCMSDENSYSLYLSTYNNHYSGEGVHPLVFNRACNLYAIESILISNKIVDIDNFDMRDINIWEAILKFLLAINSKITEIKDSSDDVTFEDLNANVIALNELFIETNPYTTPYRGLQMIDFIINNGNYSTEFINYFNNELNCSPDEFIYQVYSLYITNKQEDYRFEFFYNLKQKNKFIEFLSSKRIDIENPQSVLNIKKSPFYKDNETKYILLDNTILLEKSFDQLIFDFWFDHLKHQKKENGQNKYTIKEYIGELGVFFENYVKEILSNAFQHLKHPPPKFTNELKFNTTYGSYEFADIYIRQNKKLIIGEIKFGSIYDNEKLSGDIDGLYKNDRNKFFSDFGVNQIIESINKLLDFYQNFDPKLEVNKQLKIFPVLVVNHKTFQTPLMAEIFNERFQELLKTEVNKKNYLIYPLTLIHINELERLELKLYQKSIDIWDLLRYHVKSKLIPPFYDTVNKKVGQGNYSDKILDRYKELIYKYSPNP